MALRRSSRIATTAATIASTTLAKQAARSAVIPPAQSRVGPLSPLSSLCPDYDDNPRPTKRKRATLESEAKSDGEESEPKTQKQTRRRKSPPPEPIPDDFTPRVTNRWKIGPHVSSSGGVENSVINAAAVGANAFAIFLKSQRKWESNALKEESVAKFKARMNAFGYSASHVLPHGSYLVNLGNPDKEKREKSYACFLDDLKRCEELGLQLYNFHPGSTVGAATKAESMTLIAECVNRVHKETERVIIVLENMAGSGNIVGSRFSELGDIIKQVDDKTRVGVCLDTCHMFAAGYDITTRAGWDATMDEFDRDVGLSYLRGMHINDSKAPLASKKDRHENIGLGHLGLRTFAYVLSDPRTRDIPLILETPAYDAPASSSAAKDRLAREGMSVWRTEVSVLNRLSERLAVAAKAEDGDPAQEGEGEIGESEYEAWRDEIQEAVKMASKARDAKGRKVDGSGKKAKKAKKGKRRKGEEADDMEDEDDSCGEDH
ncbi:AP endonuclease [Ganoderma leucocontextum]|nr:AP endonuclease [Ganoderma leucocontextum]